MGYTVGSFNIETLPGPVTSLDRVRVRAIGSTGGGADRHRDPGAAEVAPAPRRSHRIVRSRGSGRPEEYLVYGLIGSDAQPLAPTVTVVRGRLLRRTTTAATQVVATNVWVATYRGRARQILVASSQEPNSQAARSSPWYRRMNRGLPRRRATYQSRT
ncbi:hypothetical protein KGA66_24535 [Actinocrinis puniceicyclus]|uniref:Uncharacterized protein n=1 Tax=Actinocrinis puniceicyclus TaxID=977794 RepID=A0A8J8BF36_9ACTN|nr:hypothetical protein [Actinocrinis puniceicyclus]MBS2966235.1 hypothetical protein [Actinocrinis puniceicyclus]